MNLLTNILPELYYEILINVNVDDVLNVNMVCKYLNNIIGVDHYIHNIVKHDLTTGS